MGFQNSIHRKPKANSSKKKLQRPMRRNLTYTFESLPWSPSPLPRPLARCCLRVYVARLHKYLGSLKTTALLALRLPAKSLALRTRSREPAVAAGGLSVRPARWRRGSVCWQQLTVTEGRVGPGGPRRT